MNTADVVIAGGGIIGLSAALELSRAGHRVVVVERARAMGESSWAAAGMLAAEDPENPADLVPLAALSARLYPDFLDRVAELCGRSVPLRTNSTLQVSHQRQRFSCPDTPTRARISGADARSRIPALKPGECDLLWLDEPSLDPRDLCSALPLAASAGGVELRENTQVLRVRASVAGVEVATTSGPVSAGAFINCCGAWASAIEGAGQLPPDTLEPRKGQMMAVQMEGPERLGTVVRTPDVYLVPRNDHRIVVGASVERAGYDRAVDPGTIHALRMRAAEVWPPILSGPMVESWAGLRPGTADELPLLGATDAPMCWVGTGHFRNGILLAPATALVLRTLIEGVAPPLSLDAFHPGRWQHTASGDNAFSAAL